MTRILKCKTNNPPVDIRSTYASNGYVIEFDKILIISDLFFRGKPIMIVKHMSVTNKYDVTTKRCVVYYKIKEYKEIR
jgi:hypothetical protein